MNLILHIAYNQLITNNIGKLRYLYPECLMVNLSFRRPAGGYADPLNCKIYCNYFWPNTCSLPPDRKVRIAHHTSTPSTSSTLKSPPSPSRFSQKQQSPYQGELFHERHSVEHGCVPCLWQPRGKRIRSHKCLLPII